MISIVIPCYNEATNIKHLFIKANDVNRLLSNTEFIFVNNGSNDNTLLELQFYKSLYIDLNIKIVNLINNIGYGNGILNGILMSSNNILAWTHADLQTDLEDIIEGYNIYINENNKYCLVKGNRIDRPFFDLFFTKSMEFIAFLFTKTFIKDINAQPKIFSKDFFLQIYNDNLPLDFSFDFYFLYHAKKIGYIKTFNVNFRSRKFDLSKGGGTLYGKLKLTNRTLTYLFNFSK
jgi:glycosyltransferase involved in cell wall biosynthesis